MATIPPVLEAVVTVINTHHPRAREASRRVVLAARELPAMERAEWLPMLRAWEAFSKTLTHHMHEEEELMLDRVQLFAARKMLTPGALHASRGTFEELLGEHSRQHELARAVREAL
jgi:iron-sulfur cluster repair protein YtfE (RIC family)